jgi:hypothetical protein
MVLGLSLATYTLLHVLISLVGIACGFVVMFGLLTSKRLDGWTALFLFSTVLTSVSGFAFPFTHFLPSHTIGIVSLVVLAVAIPARYTFHLAGRWRWVYVVGAATALYLNVFILVVQAFRHVPPLKAIAPTQTESPFFVAQVIVLVAFIGLTIVVTKRFHTEIEPATARAA